MKKSPHATPSIRDLSIPTRAARRISTGRLAAGALALAFLAGGAAQAATFGHARLASGAGEPLLILVPVSGLTDADLQALSARPAPAADWSQAGLTPPVPLDSLSVSVGPDVRAGGRRVLRVGSGQAFSGNLADLLLDVRTATGEQRYQVSLVAPGPARAAASAAARAAGQGASTTAVGAAAPHASTRRVPAGAIAVRPGDTMFAISRRHAVDGVSIYQLMMALQRANPQAFIHDNVNLVRAGASLAVPDINDMLSISDAEARRQFQAQAAAFARMRGRLAGAAASADAGRAAAGAVSPAESRADARSAGAAGDRLRLSESGRKGAADATADARTARGHALKDAEARVDQLQSNVQNLNQALQSQGEAARSAAAQGAEAIGHSIQQIASAISEASQEAAAQADEEASTGGGSGASGAPGSAGASAPGANPAGATGPGAGSGASSTNGGAGSGGAASSMSAGEASTGAGAASPAVQAAELQPSEHAQHRASWLQDHLLGVMTGLLALIVLIIAWLLRRANAARDEAEAGPRVTESMVRERIQDIDLNLEPGESRPPQR